MMHLVLYPGRGVIGALIRFQTRGQTRGQFGHAATCYDEGGVPTIYESQYPHGVTRRLFDRKKDHVRGVEWYRVDCDEESALRFARQQLGKRYDYWSVLRFVTRRQEDKESRGMWFCSEYTFAQVLKGGARLFNECDPCNVSPSILPMSVLIHRVHCPY
jgi:hypothetical protein